MCPILSFISHPQCAEERWFASLDTATQPRPDCNDRVALVDFLVLAYIEKRWVAEDKGERGVGALMTS